MSGGGGGGGDGDGDGDRALGRDAQAHNHCIRCSSTVRFRAAPAAVRTT